MSIPAPRLTSWSGYTTDQPSAGENISAYVGRLHRPDGRTAVLWCHDRNIDAFEIQRSTYQPVVNAHAGTGHPVIVPRLGGNHWATNGTVGTGGLIDQAIAYEITNQKIRADKIAGYGVGMGALNLLNWAWRNSAKIRSLILVGPIPDLSAYYTANPTLQAEIDTDWGGHAAFTAGLPTSNPMQNLDLIRPFGHRIKIFYAASDEFVTAAAVEAFAELVGADLTEVPGNHAALITGVRPDLAAGFTNRQIQDRRTAYLRWDDTDLARVDQVLFNGNATPALRNVNTRRTLAAGAGRRYEFTRLSGTDGNERWGHLLNDFQVPDVAVVNTWYNGDGAVSAGVPGIMVGQHGNIMGAHIDQGAGTFLLSIAWVNILFNIPWIIDRGVWSGLLGTPTLNQPHTETSEIPGLRLAAGGQILASSRAGNVVTLVVHEEDLDAHFRSGILDIVMAGAIGNYTSTLTNKVVRVDANHLQYTLAGADVTSGGPGSWADFTTCFPYTAETELFGGPTGLRQMRGRFYKPGQDPPAWGDPDWTFLWTDTGHDGWAGYGQAGAMIAHTGINDPGKVASQQIGPLRITEM